MFWALCWGYNYHKRQIYKQGEVTWQYVQRRKSNTGSRRRPGEHANEGGEWVSEVGTAFLSAGCAGRPPRRRWHLSQDWKERSGTMRSEGRESQVDCTACAKVLSGKELGMSGEDEGGC